MDFFDHMVELSGQGFFCSQIMLIMGLQADNKENADLVRAMSGLNGGLGFTGHTCGALTGGCALLGYYCGKGSLEETANPNLNDMVKELVDWFEDTMGKTYGGINCDDIIEKNPANKMQRCPAAVEGTFNKCMEILQKYGITPGL